MRKSTEGLIALQFVAVALPIAAVLALQLLADSRRAETLARSRPLRNLASGARAGFVAFANGAADAVDTGALGQKSASALRDAADQLDRLAQADPAGLTATAASEVAGLAHAVGRGATLATLLPLRERIVAADRITREVDAAYTARDEAVVREAVAAATRQKRIVGLALLASFGLSAVFGLATRARLRRQLEAEASLERRVQAQLREASRHAGMAEVATSVLHNVGNVLNSVNVSASLLADRLRQSRAAGLGKAAALLQEQSHDLARFLGSDERGRALPGYLSGLAQQLQAERQEALAEMESLRRNIDHIKEVVAMQQSHARLAGVSEPVVPAELVEECLLIGTGDFAQHGIALEREFAAVPPITVDKHKVVQILVNLLRNACHACRKAGGAARRVRVSVSPDEAGLRVAVADDGVGIAPADMNRIFHYGFTTKAEGHGFGLHASALAAREMGGSLQAASDGPGLGATFTLRLPLLPPGPSHA